LKKTKDILIFIFAFVVIFAIGFMFYMVNHIQKKYAGEPYEQKTILSSSRYLCGFSNDSIKIRTEYKVIKIIADSIIEFTYLSRTDSTRNFQVKYKNYQNELFLEHTGYAKIEVNRFQNDRISTEYFDSYVHIKPEIDGMAPILFNPNYGILGIGNPLGPAAFFFEKKPDIDLIKDVSDKLY
jgi:hypothetical protein